MPPHVPVYLLTPAALTLALADVEGGQPAALASRPLAATTWVPGDVAGRGEGVDVAALAAAARECAERIGRPVRKARLLLEGPLVRPFALPISFRPDDAELRTAVQTEAERYALFAGSEVAVAFEVLRQEPERLSMLFAAMRKDALDAIVEAFRTAGVALEAVEPLPVALARGLAETFEPTWDVTGEPAGIAMLTARRLDISTWNGGLPSSWRGVAVDGEKLRLGDEATLVEATIELQRTLIDLPTRRWLLADMPPALAAAIRARPEVEVAEWSRGGELEHEAFRACGPEMVEAFSVDLLPPPPPRERRFTNAQLGLAVAFGLVAAGLLAAMLVVDGRIRAVRRELDAVQGEIVALQSAIQAEKRGQRGSEAIESAVRGSALVGMAFDALRACTPADSWISEARIDSTGQLALAGISLSPGSPFAFAKALAAWPELEDVGMPEIRRDAIRGREVHRFRLTARTAAPAGQAKPAPTPTPGARP